MKLGKKLKRDKSNERAFKFNTKIKHYIRLFQSNDITNVLMNNLDRSSFSSTFN